MRLKCGVGERCSEYPGKSIKQMIMSRNNWSESNPVPEDGQEQAAVFWSHCQKRWLNLTRVQNPLEDKVKFCQKMSTFYFD